MNVFYPGQLVRINPTGEEGRIQLRRNAMLVEDKSHPLGESLVDRGPAFVIDQRGKYAVDTRDANGRHGWVFCYAHELTALEGYTWQQANDAAPPTPTTDGGEACTCASDADGATPSTAPDCASAVS